MNNIHVRKSVSRILCLLLLIVSVLCSGCAGANSAAENGSNGSKETTETFDSTAAFLAELENILDGVIGEHENIDTVTLENKALRIVVDLSNADPAPLTFADLAWSRAGSITDTILLFEEYDDLWEEITIDFGEAGSVSCNRSDVVSSEYGRYMPATISDSLLGF